MAAREFRPGFRLSVLDGAVLAGGTTAAFICRKGSPEVSVIVAMVVGHFFLFCNVFRIPRLPELIWGAVFLSLAGTTLTMGKPAWPVTIGISLIVSGILIARETRRPDYHGIFWSRLNPGLPEWWRTLEGDRQNGGWQDS